MPTDNLTERLKEEFARRGKIVSSSQINQILANRGISPGVAAPTAPVTQMASGEQSITIPILSILIPPIATKGLPDTFLADFM